MNEWLIGLSSWIMQDGNYDNFARNERAAFALEFYPRDVRASSLTKHQSSSNGPGRYHVNAQVISVFPFAWVIDFGVQAYQQATPPEMVQKGRWINADIYLGVDPFFYFEDLSHADGMPPIIHDWIVRKITIQTAPFIETHDKHGRVTLTRDESKSHYREIERTDAWNDDNGHGDYVLHCELSDSPPRKTLR